MIRSSTDTYQIEDGNSADPPSGPSDASTDLLRRPDPLRRAYGVMEDRGLVGEKKNAKTLFLAGLGGCLGEPIHVAVHGESSAGKNELARRALELLPDRLVHPLTGISTHALEYRDDAISGVLLLQEVHGQSDAEYQLREAMSEGRVTRWTVDKDGDGELQGRELEVEVEASIVTTTTRTSLHPENATRVFVLEADASPEQTEEVLKKIGERAADPGNGDEHKADVRRWQKAICRLEGRTVAVPFARQVTTELPTEVPRTRRDAKRALALVRVHALLNQHRRNEDEEGRIVAEREDYEKVYPLLGQVLEPSVSGLTETARDLIELHEELADEEETDGVEGEWVKRTKLEEKAHEKGVASRNTVHSWAKRLSREGIWEGERRSRGAWWHRSLGDPDSGVLALPEPDELDPPNPPNGSQSGGGRE